MQANIALISIGCFYLVSIPTALYLAFIADYGIIGLWLGLSIGTFMQMIIIAVMTFKADWQEIAKEV